MPKLNNASTLHSIAATPQALSHLAATSKRSEDSLSSVMNSLMSSISESTKRMATDEAYRLKIAKDLS
jgi:hypothetical protein